MFSNPLVISCSCKIYVISVIKVKLIEHLQTLIPSGLGPLLLCDDVAEHSDRPCRLYHIRTFGLPVELAWVTGKAIHTFHGGFEFEQLPLLRRRGRQRDEDYKYIVNMWHSLCICWTIMMFMFYLNVPKNTNICDYRKALFAFIDTQEV